jgi:hypothetical protein
MSNLSRRELLLGIGSLAALASLPSRSFSAGLGDGGENIPRELASLIGSVDVRRFAGSTQPWRPQIDAYFAHSSDSFSTCRVWLNRETFFVEHQFPDIGDAAIIYEVPIRSLDVSRILTTYSPCEESAARIVIHTKGLKKRVIVRRIAPSQPTDFQWRWDDPLWSAATVQSHICLFTALRS